MKNTKPPMVMSLLMKMEPSRRRAQGRTQRRWREISRMKTLLKGIESMTWRRYSEASFFRFIVFISVLKWDEQVVLQLHMVQSSLRAGFVS